MSDTPTLAPDVPAIEAALTARGLLNGPDLERVRRLEAESGERCDRIAAKLGLVSERDLAAAYAELLGSPLLAAADFPLDPVAPDRVRRAFARHARLVPIQETEDAITIAMADPLDQVALRALDFALAKPVLRRAALPADVDAALERLYGEGGMRVRIRIDGVLREAEPPPARLRPATVSRVKIMARLDIAERRLAQDGRIRITIRGKDVDLRVSTTPSVHGESVVLRILDRGALALDFAQLGFDETLLQPFLEVLRRPHGVVLVTGPTGSGKTTTLYTALTLLNAPGSKILSVEMARTLWAMMANRTAYRQHMPQAA